MGYYSTVYLYDGEAITVPCVSDENWNSGYDNLVERRMAGKLREAALGNTEER